MSKEGSMARLINSDLRRPYEPPEIYTYSAERIQAALRPAYATYGDPPYTSRSTVEIARNWREAELRAVAFRGVTRGA